MSVKYSAEKLDHLMVAVKDEQLAALLVGELVAD